MQQISGFFRLSSKLNHDVSPLEINCPVSEETMRKNARQVQKYAEQCRSSLKKFSDAWCKAAGLSPQDSVVMGPLKTIDRIVEKAAARYQGDVYQVSDVSRDRILIDSPGSVKALKNIINSHDFVETANSKGVNVLSVEDFFETPTKTLWRGLVVKIETDLGKTRFQKSEIVVMPRGWVNDYETTHTYLENIRALEDCARAQDRPLSTDEQGQVNKYVQMARVIHFNLAYQDDYMALEKTPVQQAPELRLVG